MTKKTLVLTLAAAAVAAFGGWAFSTGWSGVKAAKAASNNVFGTFGYSVQGTVNGAALSAAGILTADGNGGVTGSEPFQVQGYGIQNTTFTGSYTLDNAGSGDMVINYPALPPDPNNPDVAVPTAPMANYHFVIVNGGAELKAIRTDSGVVATSSFRMQ